MENFVLNLLSGIGNIDFPTVWKIAGIIYAIFWIVVLDLVWVDSGERTTNKVVRIFYVILVAALNIFGWLIYLIIRPSQTIEQIYWADLERRYLKYETAELGDCPKCGMQLFPGFTYCPECNYELKTKCPNCNVYVEKKYKHCPYCGEHTNKPLEESEKAPSIEIMEKQVQESKTKAAEVVESQMTRYSSSKEGVVVRLGKSIIGGYSIIIGGVMNMFKKRAKSIEENSVENSNRSGKKKKKNRKKKH